MTACRGCGAAQLERVLDLGRVPAADHFPPVGEPVRDEATHALAMDLCTRCGLAQLAEDDTVTAEPRGVEPQALVDQAGAALADVAAAGFLHGRTVREFGSPHGGTWLPMLADRGYAERPVADLVLDCFGIMHEPDQRAAFAARADALAPGGVLALQYHSLATIVRDGQWNALRHGHFAYYSLPTLQRLLADAGLTVIDVFTYDLYGGTVLALATKDPHAVASAAVRDLAEAEAAMTDPETVRDLQRAADAHAVALRRWATARTTAGEAVYAYGAASRAVALLYRAGIDRTMVRAVADASPAKQGRRMPGTDIPIISPDELVAASPDSILLTLPDLLDEVSRRYPALAGRWYVDGVDIGVTDGVDIAVTDEAGVGPGMSSEKGVRAP